jgi:CheY-like chemotaxis protein
MGPANPSQSALSGALFRAAVVPFWNYFSYFGPVRFADYHAIMGLESLLLCRDPDTLRVFRRALDDLGIAVEVATVAESALDRLRKAKFDAVIVDCDDVPGGTEVLTGIQLSPSNKRAIAIAIINGASNMRAVFEMGAHFTLDKPVTLERASRSLRAAHGFMVAEQRRYFRHAVDTSAYLSFGVVKELACKVTNVSDGGMAIILAEQINPGWSVDVRFELPGVQEEVALKGEFAWSDGKGNAGIRFVYVSIEGKRSLGRWLAGRVDTTEPALTRPKPTPRRSVAI